MLNRANITGFDAGSYITSHSKNASALPNIAVAVSGGGYRALLNGAGAIAALDSRVENSTSSGHLGGLLQSSTYLAGLSGGGWLVGSLYANNFSTVTALRDNSANSSSLWEFQNSIFTGPDTGGIQTLDSVHYYDNIYEAVKGKGDAGYDTSITDYWGRALSYQLVNASQGGSDYSFSSVASQDFFTNGDSPMPILVTDGRAPGQLLISANATIYEFNAFEFGSWDPTTYGFAPLEYLGSNFSGGVLPDNEQCVRGFDNAGFVMGTSSSLFNQFLLQINNTNIASVFKDALTKVLQSVGQDNNDIAVYSPNPFLNYHNTTSRVSQSPNLTLVDGGEDLQNIPLHPLIQPNRAVDVIFAVDSSADTTSPPSPGANWPNGTSLVATYERSLNHSGIGNGTSFPAIPDTNTFVNLGLNTRPTFFGCNSSNTTSPTPLIVYLPNTPYVYYSNVSTFDPSYNYSVRNAIIENGYVSTTMGNGTVDPQWPTCVACAILSRSLERTGTAVPNACQECFTRYCWNGTLASGLPAPFNPTPKLGTISVAKSGVEGRRRVVGIILGLVVGVTMFVVV